MSIDRMIVKVAGAAWRLLGVKAQSWDVAPSNLAIDIVAKVPGGSYESIFDTVPIISSGNNTSTGGVIRGDRRILPIGTLVRLGDTEHNADITTELHYRTRAVSQ